MRPWVALRAKRPELFERVLVYSQPAANVDSVIHCWQIEAESSEVGACVYQRDMFAAAHSVHALRSSFLAMQLRSFILSKMTARLQLTDTDVSRRFQSDCHLSMEEQRAEGEKKLRSESSTDMWVAGTEAILVAINSAQNKLEVANAAEEFVLGGLRRKFFLAYQPMPSGLQPVTPAALAGESWAQWAADKPEGSRRLKPEWYSERLSWRDETGKPLPPHWELSSLAKSVSELIEWNYAHPEHEA
jgi:hypothetical protein